MDQNDPFPYNWTATVRTCFTCLFKLLRLDIFTFRVIRTCFKASKTAHFIDHRRTTLRTCLTCFFIDLIFISLNIFTFWIIRAGYKFSKSSFSNNKISTTLRTFFSCFCGSIFPYHHRLFLTVVQILVQIQLKHEHKYPDPSQFHQAHFPSLQYSLH